MPIEPSAPSSHPEELRRIAMQGLACLSLLESQNLRPKQVQVPLVPPYVVGGNPQGHNESVLDIKAVIGQLQRLPTELLLKVESYLPESSVIALSHANSRFYRSASRVIEDVIDRHCIRSRRTANRRRAKENTKMYLKIDDKGHEQESETANETRIRQQQLRYVCVTCRKVKGHHSFSLAATRGPSNKRQCLAHEGRLWICPDKIWDTHFAKRMCRAMSRSRDMLTLEGDSMSGLCACGNHYLFFENDAVIQARLIKIWLGPVGGTLELDIKNIKRNFNIRCCPHMSISNRKVLDRFSGQCQRSFSASAVICFCKICRNLDDLDDSTH